MITESLTAPGAPILWGVTCIGLPFTALWVRTVGITRILAVLAASLWATARAIIAAKVEYRRVYREIRTAMEGAL